MLSPEISDFPPPKVYLFGKENLHPESATRLIGMNHFYKSVIVTCPDEHNIQFIEKVINYDSMYYKISNCPFTEFTNPNFINFYVKCGKVTCLSADSNCIVQNSVAITPDGTLTLHVMEADYQTLGLEGAKRPHGYHDIKIDLLSLKKFTKLKNALAKLGTSDFYITWEPSASTVCPSSIARYFYRKNIEVSAHDIAIEIKTPEVKKIPVLVDVETEDLVEWMGMLAHEGDIWPKEEYISTYSEPQSLAPMNTTRMSILIAKGFITPITLISLCDTLASHVVSREPHHYWIAMSIQGFEESLWQFAESTPRMFNSHNSSTSIIFSRTGCSIYSAAQLKYS